MINSHDHERIITIIIIIRVIYSLNIENFKDLPTFI